MAAAVLAGPARAEAVAVVANIFHADSYGYRPGRGAHDALAVARKRCWKFDWVLEFDIRAFFDSVPHDLVVRAVEGLRLSPWVLLYVKRWLTAPVLMPDGGARGRDRGLRRAGYVQLNITRLMNSAGLCAASS